MGEEQRKLIEQGQKQLQAIEAEKRVLYDRTIGGPSMPRPSVNFIKENVGKQKSQVQTDREAFAHIYPKMNQKAANAWLVKNTPATPTPAIKLREAWNANDRQPTAQKQATSKEQLREAWKAADRQTAPQIASQQQLRDAWNAKPDPARAKQRDKQRESAVERDREKRRCSVGPIIPVLIEEPVGITAPAHETDRVDVEREHCLATLSRGLGKEHDCFAGCEIRFVHPVGMLHEQKAEVRGRLMGCGDR